MDIARLSMNMAMNQTQQQFGVAMLKNSLDLMEDAGGTIQMLAEAAPAPSLNPPGVGGNVDIRV
ncbi:MAG: YjfB family protein [Lachnospiraceae bacterium]|nr:YjfB family protein [Lachnospiraceae bacterium]